MALTSRTRLLLALIGLLLLPDQNEARVLSETRIGYDDDSSESVGPSDPSANTQPVNRQPVDRSSAAQPQQNQSFSIKIPVLESQPEVVPEPEIVPEPEVVPTFRGPIREDLESGSCKSRSRRRSEQKSPRISHSRIMTAQSHPRHRS